MADTNAWKSDAEGMFIEMDAGEKKDYSLDWTDFLGTDVISTVVWTVPAGVTKLAQAETTKASQARLYASGAVGVYACSVTMTSAGGLVDVQEFRVVIA